MEFAALSRRDILRTAGTMSAAALAGSLTACGKSSQKPNIVLIMADDLGYEGLSCYGSTSYSTPRLDELAQTGVRFNHCYAQPLCTPTRIQIMTGQYNFRNYVGFMVLKPGEKTFGDVMQAAGYATCVAGKWQLWNHNEARGLKGQGVWPDDAGFDEHCSWLIEEFVDRYADPRLYINSREQESFPGAYGPDICCDYLLDFIERKRDEPFFAYHSMILPHNPFMPTPDSPQWKDGDRHEDHPRFFKDMVEYVDKLTGRVIDKLDELGLRENTIVMFLGDNGTNELITSQTVNGSVKGNKGYPDDAGTRVPFIVNCPGLVKSGLVLDDLVDTTDFLPTIMEATGASLLDGMVQDGRSFLPQLRGEAGNPRDWVFCHYDPDWADFPKSRFARDHRWKLYDDGRLFDVPADVLEQRPIMADSGGPESTAARRKLQAVLDRLQ
jgi:arylsulfatase A